MVQRICNRLEVAPHRLWNLLKVHNSFQAASMRLHVLIVNSAPEMAGVFAPGLAVVHTIGAPR
jgi:hypothetical protein